MDKSKKIKQLRNENGITLIALVITIIILIILAGVSINILFDNDGLIDKAKKAAENMEIAQVEEQEMLNELINDLEGNIVPIQPEGPVVIEGPVAGGSYDNPYIPTGFSHTEGEGTWNSGYIITEKDTGNKFVWVPCVLDQTKVKTGDNVVTFGNTLPSTTSTTDSNYMYNKNNVTITGEQNPASAIRTSVGTYGGFYIAAYEAGVPLNESGVEIEPTSATVTQKARSVSDAKAWTNISRTNAITAASNMIDSSKAGVNSGLISGKAWDTTLKWMVTTSDNAENQLNAGYDIDSTGYYGQAAKTTTGQFQVNNIYDMGGNVWEWTTENCTNNGNNYLVCRGGCYNDSGSDYPASYRHNRNDGVSSNITFRVVLYK